VAFDPEALEKAIFAYPREAEKALAQLRMSFTTDMPDLDGLRVGAAMLNQQLEETWVDALRRRGLIDAFVLALNGEGIGLTPKEVPADDTNWPRKPTAAFLHHSDTFRCRILRNGQPSGSGVLVGPSTVLTAWHVIAVAPPKQPQQPAPRIEVELADGRRIEAAVPARFEQLSTPEEYDSRLPGDDAAFGEQNDVALLLLKEPAGIHFAFAKFASPAYAYPGRAAMALVHYPRGQDHGVAFGAFRAIRGLTARWGHNLTAEGGSSGGGCFDTRFRLVGIHQGRRPSGGGRLVPAVRFPAALLECIAADETPDTVWSLDGTVRGDLVIGRDAFFHAYAAARRKPRARGLWIKRTDLTRDVSGLPFSYRLLERMVARSPNVRLLRISFDAVMADLPDEIARRAAEAGFPVAAPIAQDGVGLTHTQEEAVISDRSRRLAIALEAAALAQEVQLWVYFDHPAIAFGDQPRWAIASFVDQSIRMDSLRIAIGGYEAVQMPGQQFVTPFEADGDGPPGLMIEYLTGFTRTDVRALIRRAAEDIRRTISDERVDEWTDEALHGLPHVSGVYDGWRGTTVSERLQPRLAQLNGDGA
jgi:hypothetical protein